MNKISKGKAVGLLSLGLASVALGSVGFAAWVVSGTTVSGTSNISVTVGAVNDERVTIKAEIGDDAGVNFDADTVDGLGTMGIKAVSGSSQDMTFSVKVTAVKGAQSKVDKVACKFAVTLPGSLENVDSYVKLIEVKQGDTNITSSYSTSFDIVPTETGTPVIYTFKFGWGEKFNLKNPVAMNSSESVTVDTILGYLGELKKAMEKGTISVVLQSA